MLQRMFNTSLFRVRQTRFAKKYFATSSTKDVLPQNIIGKETSAHLQKQNGAVYDKQPFKMELQAGKKYMWCLCGHSKTQPLCDGTHRQPNFRITLKPIRFSVEETKTYWMCNCKHTKKRPFCDGTHKLDEVQEQNSLVRQ